MPGIIPCAGNRAVNKMYISSKYTYVHIVTLSHTQTCTPTASLHYNIVTNNTDSKVKLVSNSCLLLTLRFSEHLLNLSMPQCKIKIR